MSGKGQSQSAQCVCGPSLYPGDGLAWWCLKYARHDRGLEELDAAAKAAKRGLWADADLVPPWGRVLRLGGALPRSITRVDKRTDSLYDNKVKTAVYCRVSTADRTCDLQRRELNDYCQRRGWQIADEYIDTGWSGAKAVRPELTRLMNDARKRRFDAVVVWRLDRWGRSVPDSIKSIQELDSLGVRFVAVTQNIDTDEKNPMSRFLLVIMSAFAELEKELIRERTVAGVKAARANGKTLGRPRRVFRRDEAMRLRGEGLSWRAIAKRLEVPVTTVVDACRCSEIAAPEAPIPGSKTKGKRKAA